MALNVVTKLRDLAAIEENRYFIVRDRGCLPGLVAHLNNEEDQVKFVACEAIHFLSLYPGNREPMAMEPGLVLAIKALSQYDSEHVNKLAMATLNNLQAYIKRAPSVPTPSRTVLKERSTNSPQEQTMGTKPSVTPSASSAASQKSAAPSGVISSSSSSQPRSSDSRSGSGVSGGRLGQARTVTLYVAGLTNEEARKKVELALLKVKGVVSFLIDLYGQKVVIRSLVTADVLQQALVQTGMKCSTRQIPKLSPESQKKSAAAADESEDDEEDEDEEEDDDEEDDDEEGDDEPDYLDEPEEEEAKTQEANKYAIVTEEYAARKAEENVPAGGGWFGRISKALWG